MKAKITRELLREIKTDKRIEITDTLVPGFVVRVSESGHTSFYIRGRHKQTGRPLRHHIGNFEKVKVHEAREQAKKLLGKLALDQELRPAKPVTMPTLFQFIDSEYRTYAATRNPRTVDKIVKRLKKCFEEFGDKLLADINAWSIDKWKLATIKRGLTHSTVNRDLVALKAVFSCAVKWGRLPEHPLKSVNKLQEDSHGGIVRFLSDQEEVALRKALDDRETRRREGRESFNEWREARSKDPLPARDGGYTDHLKPMVLTAMNTGLRRGEMLALKWENVDLKRAVLTVRGAFAKSGRTRHVPLNDEALAALTLWKEQAESEYVFPGRDGSQMQELKTAWSNLLEEAGITRFRWHDLRHHFASRLVMAGVDLNTVRELLGHSELKMTLRYAHLAPEHKAAAVAKLVRAEPSPMRDIGKKRQT